MMSDDILWELEIKHYMENQRREEKGFQRGIALGEKSGLEKGIELGQLRTLLSLVKEGLLPLDKAIKKSGLTEIEFKERLNKF